MNYPKVLYRGNHYDDYMQMGRDVHSNALEHRYVHSEEEETKAMEDGFGPLGDFIGSRSEEIIGSHSSPPIEKIGKRRGRPRLDKASP